MSKAFTSLGIKLKSFRLRIRDFFREIITLKRRKKLTNKSFSLISNNCNGGILLHEFGLEFKTPTINLYMDAKDYIEFLENLTFYSQCDLKQVASEEEYPVGILGDKLIIRFMHYKTFEEAKEKWILRTKRIDFNNMFIIMTEENGCDEEIIKRFDNLKFKNKVIFTNHEYKWCKSAIYINEFKDNPKGVYMFFEFVNDWSLRRHFDIVKWAEWFNSSDPKPNLKSR